MSDAEESLKKASFNYNTRKGDNVVKVVILSNALEAVRLARKEVFVRLEANENVSVTSKGRKPMQPALITLNRKTYFEIKKRFLVGK